MELETERIGRVVAVRVAESRIDAVSAVQFKDAMRGLPAGDADRILLDLGQVEFVDSSGLGAIVAVMKHFGPERRLELADLSRNVAAVFSLTRMENFITIHATRADALEVSAQDE